LARQTESGRLDAEEVDGRIALVAQRLAIHAADARRIRPAHPVQHRRNRQEPPALIGVLRGRCKPPKLSGRKKPF
jgi:hypothetical protein